MRRAIGGVLATAGIVVSVFAFANTAKATEGTNLCVDGETVFVLYEDLWMYEDDNVDDVTHPLGEKVTRGSCEDKKIEICHRDQGKPEWKVIEISENALAAHLAHQWGEDIYPVPANGCPSIPVDSTTPAGDDEPDETTTTPAIIITVDSTVVSSTTISSTETTQGITGTTQGVTESTAGEVVLDLTSTNTDLPVTGSGGKAVAILIAALLIIAGVSMLIVRKRAYA